MNNSQKNVDSLPDAMRPLKTAGVVVGGFALVFGAWSTLVPIASGVSAAGSVAPVSHRQIVQHLEGGVIAEIRVRDGDRVDAGDTLVELAGDQADASYNSFVLRGEALDMRLARLLAEQSGKSIDRAALAKFSNHAFGKEQQELTDAELDLFMSRKASHQSTHNVLLTQIKQLNEEIAGHEASIKSANAQASLLEDEIGDVQALLSKGLARRPRLLSLQRSHEQLKGAVASARTRIARAGQAIAETKAKLISLDQGRLESIAQEISEVRGELAIIAEREAAARTVLGRTRVTAPMTGIVMASRFHAVGGVVQPGQTLLEIVPSDEDLVVDVRISPMDRDELEPGMAARLRMLALSQRNTTPIEGKLNFIGADAQRDPMTGQIYYAGRIEVSAAALAQLPATASFTAGMPVEALLITGERTFLSYLMSPLLNGMNRAFRES